MKIAKYHGLGNDYLVISPAELTSPLTTEQIYELCRAHYGIGSDGILIGPYWPDSPDFGQICSQAGLSEAQRGDCLAALRIMNPDGSEAEKSGNGLRIFSRYVFDCSLVGSAAFRLATLGGVVRAQVFDPEKQIQVEMGRVSFLSSEIPVVGPVREVIREKIRLGEREFTFCAAGIGNPHCVILDEQLSPELAREYGPLLEKHPIFPHKINVQFLQIRDTHNIAIEIWERGAGYTLASGSSASACAAVAVKLGSCQSPVTVWMPGGQLQTSIEADFQLTQTGPVKYVFTALWPEQPKG